MGMVILLREVNRRDEVPISLNLTGKNTNIILPKIKDGYKYWKGQFKEPIIGTPKN